jgi:argininosuccinate lyase
MSTIWGGRFGDATDAAVQELNASLPFDWRLGAHDLWQNRVYATELTRIGVLSEDDLAALVPAIATVETEWREGRMPLDIALEDIHMAVETRLTALCGDAAKRVHTGRSRNDQVATVFRLWLRDAVDALGGQLKALVETTLALAETHADLPCPGYTHLQRAQVVSFGHHLHAYAEMFARDIERLVDLRRRLNRLPLGSGALAGSPYPIDRARLAANLGFAEPTRNSMDAVSDRDFVYEFLAWGGLVGLHLSRWAEDLILWMSSEFGWVRLPDKFCTGSSIMPQKKNPDVAELARGKSGRLIGNLAALAMAVKGLPLTYNKDLQEDKEPAMDTVRQLRLLLAVWTPMVAGMQPVPERMAAGLREGHLLATDLADFLVRRRAVPFRDAHHIVGRAVKAADDAGIDVSALSDEALAAVDSRLDGEVREVLSAAASLAARRLDGGPARVRDNVAATRRALATLELAEPRLPWAFDVAPPAVWAW